MRKFFVMPYNSASESAKEIRDGLGGLSIKTEGSKYQWRQGDVVINWGCARARAYAPRYINDPNKVAVATSKLATFQCLRAGGISIPDYSTLIGDAMRYQDEGFKVLGRDLDHGRSGHGITVYAVGSPIGNHRFYVKYFTKEREFRIHVFNGKIIFRQEKLRKKGAENVDKYIRSHSRGWCFAFHHFADNPVPEVVDNLGLDAVCCLGLDFGAVDIGWNAKSGAVVFEINTAPGIENTSLSAYVKAFEAL